MRLMLLAITVSCSSAIAGLKQFNATSGNWSQGSNWTPSGVPAQTDRAVIPSGKTCTVDGDFDVDTVDVEGELIVGAGNTLTLHNTQDNVAADPDDSIINGTLLLQQSGGELDIASATHAFTGSGLLQGEAVSCKISIAHNITLVNKMSGAFLGSMTIDSTLTPSPSYGTFQNDGKVWALGTIVLAQNPLLEDSDSAEWFLDDGAHIEFHRAANLKGEFVGSSCGTFEFEDVITTCGTWTRNACDIIIAGSGTFKYKTYVQGTGYCGPNPGSSVTLTACSSSSGWAIAASTNCCP
jgi:hypothetical protein